ncbi:hypothetical protein EBV26_14200 [bacterium]|nr:hypothetical protein [bacterium]
MGNLCIKQPKIIEHNKTPIISQCSIVKSHTIKCISSGTFGCFSYLDINSYNKLLSIKDYEGITVIDENNNNNSFNSLLELINPNREDKGAFKFIKELTYNTQTNLEEIYIGKRKSFYDEQNKN